MFVEKFLDILVCPICKGKLELIPASKNKEFASEETFLCTRHKMNFAVTKGAINFRDHEKILEEKGNWKLSAFENFYEKMDKWDSIYDWDRKHNIPKIVSTYVYSRAKGRMLKWLQPRSNEFILDIGCGNGYFIFEMMNQIYPQLNYFVGVDVSKHNIENFCKKIKREKKENILSILGNAEKLPFADNSFSIITCSEVIEHIEHKKEAIREIYRILKHDGVFIFSTPSKFGDVLWKRIILPAIFVKKILGTFRKKQKVRMAEDRAYDAPLYRKELFSFLKQTGFATIHIENNQILNWDIVKHLPMIGTKCYIYLADKMEGCSKAIRRVFGLRLVGYAKK